MTVLNLQVSASADDAYQESNGDTSITATAELIDREDEWIGLRWQNVTIPQGSTILSADLQVWITDSTTDEPYISILVEDADNSSAFSAGSNNDDISSRSVNAYSVDIDNSNIGLSGQFVSLTPTNGNNFGALVSIVVNRAGWASGNALSFIIKGSTGIDLTRDFGINFYDASAARGAKLIITYTAPGSGNDDMPWTTMISSNATQPSMGHYGVSSY